MKTDDFNLQIRDFPTRRVCRTRRWAEMEGRFHWSSWSSVPSGHWEQYQRSTLQTRGCFLLPSCVKFVVPHFTTTFCVVEPPVQNQDKKCRLVQNSDKKFRLWKRQQDRVLLLLSCRPSITNVQNLCSYFINAKGCQTAHPPEHLLLPLLLHLALTGHT